MLLFRLREMLNPHGNGQGVRLSLIWLLPRTMCSGLGKGLPSLDLQLPSILDCQSQRFTHCFGHKQRVRLPGSYSWGRRQKA